MKSLVCTLSLIFVTLFTVNAQTDDIIYSTPFEEQEGYSKVLQLSNGNTVVLHFNLPDAIQVSVYDPNHKLKSQSELTGKDWGADKKVFRVVGVYEIAGQPVIFLPEWHKKDYRLHRVILNSETGKIDTKSIIYEIPYVDVIRYYVHTQTSKYVCDYNLDDPRFYIEKDPNSDAYVVIHTDYANENDEKRIELKQFTVEGGNHKLIQDSYYKDHGFKLVIFMGAQYTSDHNIIICAHGANSDDKSSDGTKFIISNWDTKTDKFTHSNLNIADGYTYPNCMVKYNASLGVVQLLAVLNKVMKKNMYTTHYFSLTMNYIDPKTLSVISSVPINNDFMKQNGDNSNGMFIGRVQDFIISKDNTTTILTEEQVYRGASSSSDRPFTTLGNLGVILLDSKGYQINGFVINKSQLAPHKYDDFFISKQLKGVWNRKALMPAPNTKEFVSCDYVQTGVNSYFIYNDYDLNNGNNALNPKTVKVFTTSSAIIGKFDKGRLDKKYLYETPSNNANTFSYIGASNYSETTKTYATIVIQRSGKKKVARVAWLKIE